MDQMGSDVFGGVFIDYDFLIFKEKIDHYFRPKLVHELHHYQGSLERFSKQISKVMKISDLEAALNKEINEIIPVNRSAFLR